MNAYPPRALRLRRLMLVPPALVAVVLCGAQAASWACVPQPFVTVQPNASGPPGTAITLTGRNFGNGIVEVRWNAFDGAQLASAQGPEFNVSASVPQAPGGLYNLIIFKRDVEGAAGLSVSIPFEVTGAGGPAGAAPPARATGSSRRSSGLADDLVLVALVAGGVLIGVVATVSLRRGRERGTNRPGRSDAANDARPEEVDVHGPHA